MSDNYDAWHQQAARYLSQEARRLDVSERVAENLGLSNRVGRVRLRRRIDEDGLEVSWDGKTWKQVQAYLRELRGW